MPNQGYSSNLVIIDEVSNLTATKVDVFKNLEQILPPCPLCDSKDHMRCRFEKGSVYCYTHDCANPHHRSRM